MQQRLPSLLDVPITFAHRGARAISPENTIPAFRLALEMGASGLESDVWLTSDGVPVLDHDGEWGRVRKKRIADLRRDELPEHIPALADLIDACGSDFDLSLDLKDPSAGAPVIEAIGRCSPDLVARTWLCHPSLDVLTPLVGSGARLVNSTRVARLGEPPERRAARLAELGIDGINLRRDEWNGGLVALFHRFDRTAFAWNVQMEHELRTMFRMGIDAVFCDHVDRMMAAFDAELR
jgi:glycerophosphoryl diester phosphodiesterase